MSNTSIKRDSTSSYDIIKGVDIPDKKTFFGSKSRSELTSQGQKTQFGSTEFSTKSTLSRQIKYGGSHEVTHFHQQGDGRRGYGAT